MGSTRRFARSARALFMALAAAGAVACGGSSGGGSTGGSSGSVTGADPTLSVLGSCSGPTACTQEDWTRGTSATCEPLDLAAQQAIFQGSCGGTFSTSPCTGLGCCIWPVSKQSCPGEAVQMIYCFSDPTYVSQYGKAQCESVPGAVWEG